MQKKGEEFIVSLKVTQRGMDLDFGLKGGDDSKSRNEPPSSRRAYLKVSFMENQHNVMQIILNNR